VPVERTEFVQERYRDSSEYREVTGIADRLLEHLKAPEIQALITTANQPGSASRGIQIAFLPFAAELGFRDESKGLFLAYESAVRPDYYLPLGETGILLEVERGKTVRNNMDFLDFWKCHVCEKAHYLFLVVPRGLQHNPQMRPVNEYAYVCRRLKTFFAPRNYTNVRGLFVFGY
jgi:hypothetical protein